MGRFRFSSSVFIFVLVTVSGMAALSWESLWQIKSTLALGVSARGTALTLAVTMGGMCLGALGMGAALKNRLVTRPLRLYAALESLIGLSGLFLNAAFEAIEKIDTHVYAVAPGWAPLVHVAGITLALGLPTICMGATLPVLGLVARQFQTSIAVLYGLNTAGAALGVLLTAFLWIPLFGVYGAGRLAVAMNFAAALAAWMMRPGAGVAAAPEQEPANAPQSGLRMALAVAFVTGFATFMLEVAWFRSMTAAFLSATDAFAVMLAVVLVALAIGAAFVPILKRNTVSLGALLGWAGIAVLLVTPVVERFDLFMYYATRYPVILYTRWFFLSLYIIGTPIVLLGVALPWLLDDVRGTKKWGLVYGANTCAAIVGSIAAAWVFLPQLGFARTAWVTGGLLLFAGLLIVPQGRRLKIGTAGICALALAVTFESGVGKTRAQGALNFNDSYVFKKVLKAYDGPEATVSAVEYEGGRRILFIDGFSTTEQSGRGEKVQVEHYMPWMGHLPMLAQPDPKNALVICFGTGQTANAVRQENPQSLDIVDINANVFKLAPFFTANEAVLDDPRVRTIIMDGRAYLRRTDKKYDVITLEPMPPDFAGVNALYSREFYDLARQRMTPDGVIAQWLPFHLVSPYYSASIARTFQSVFPNAVLWIDPLSTTGILLGSKNDNTPLGIRFPGFSRAGGARDMDAQAVQDAVILGREGIERYGEKGAIISDDNQLLAYGKAAYMFRGLKGSFTPETFEWLAHARVAPTR